MKRLVLFWSVRLDFSPGGVFCLPDRAWLKERRTSWYPCLPACVLLWWTNLPSLMSTSWPSTTLGSTGPREASAGPVALQSVPPSTLIVHSPGPFSLEREGQRNMLVLGYPTPSVWRVSTSGTKGVRKMQRSRIELREQRGQGCLFPVWLPFWWRWAFGAIGMDLSRDNLLSLFETASLVPTEDGASIFWDTAIFAKVPSTS